MSSRVFNLSSVFDVHVYEKTRREKAVNFNFYPFIYLHIKFFLSSIIYHLLSFSCLLNKDVYRN